MKKLIILIMLLSMTLGAFAQKQYTSDTYIISDMEFSTIDTIKAHVDIVFKDNIVTIYFNDRVDEEVRITQIKDNRYSGTSLRDGMWVSFTLHKECIIYYCDIKEDRTDYYYALKFLKKPYEIPSK